MNKKNVIYINSFNKIYEKVVEIVDIAVSQIIYFSVFL